MDGNSRSIRRLRTKSSRWAPDTGFSKAICRRARPGEVSFDGRLIPDHIDLSIVLSGHDMNSSIHRPERCMPAQGHDITSSSNVAFRMENGHSFKAKRLHSVKSVPGTEEGSVLKYNCVTYYFFVGHDQITNDHLERTLIDMKDRLVHGVDQRWAYLSASMLYGKLPWVQKEITEAEADEKLRKFIEEFVANQVDWRPGETLSWRGMGECHSAGCTLAAFEQCDLLVQIMGELQALAGSDAIGQVSSCLGNAFAGFEEVFHGLGRPALRPFLKRHFADHDSGAIVGAGAAGKRGCEVIGFERPLAVTDRFAECSEAFVDVDPRFPHVG